MYFSSFLHKIYHKNFQKREGLFRRAFLTGVCGRKKTAFGHKKGDRYGRNRRQKFERTGKSEDNTDGNDRRGEEIVRKKAELFALADCKSMQKSVKKKGGFACASVRAPKAYRETGDKIGK